MTYIAVEIRRFVIHRANGCCEYCLIAAKHRLVPHHVDHIIALKHGGKNDDDNLCYSCLECNQAKGSDMASLDPFTGQKVFLFNPRVEVWSEHFQLNGVIIEGLTPVGRATVKLLHMNDTDRVFEREHLANIGQYPAPELEMNQE